MTDQQSAATSGTPTPLQTRNSDVPGNTHLPGDGHMWLMVLGDLIVFGLYFAIYMVFRALAPEEFLAAQQQLNVTIGVVNTIVLVTSSWFVALFRSSIVLPSSLMQMMAMPDCMS